MALSRNNWVAIGVGIGAVVLTAVLHIIVREWYQPYVQYATGGAYISSKCGAVSTLGLKNLGYTDAEDVTIMAVFNDPLTDISAGPIGTQFSDATGGVGHKFVTGTLSHSLVPGDTASLYFFTDPSSPGFEPGQFIRGIKFKGGQGKTRFPVLPQVLLMFGSFVGMVILMSPFAYFALRARESYYTYLCEAIQMGHTAAQAGESEEQLHERVTAYRQRIPWWLPNRPKKETLIACAQAAFTLARQHPTEKIRSDPNR